MRGSLRVGRLMDIAISVHFTSLFFLGWAAASAYWAAGDPADALVGLLLAGALFLIIVLRELGHALAARWYGAPPRDMTLLPIGGVTRLAQPLDTPSQGLVVALAGPAVHVALALVLGGLLVFQGPLELRRALSFEGGVVASLFAVSVWLLGFHLLPALPTDGGRVLRGLLSMSLGVDRATRIAAGLGRGTAVLFGLAGLLALLSAGEASAPAGLLLMLVALSVWFGADLEARVVRRRAGLGRVPVGALMRREFAGVDPDDTLAVVARSARRTFQDDFPVVVAGRLVGLLGRDDLRMGLAELGPRGRVMQVMRRDFPTISPEEPAERGAAILAGGPTVVPVLYYGRLLGLLTSDEVAEFLWDQGTDREPGVESGLDRAWSRV